MDIHSNVYDIKTGKQLEIQVTEKKWWQRILASKKETHNKVCVIELHYDLYLTLSEIAKRKNIEVDELIRKFFKLGLIVCDVENDPFSELQIWEKGKVTPISLY